MLDVVDVIGERRSIGTDYRIKYIEGFYTSCLVGEFYGDMFTPPPK